MKAPSHVHEGQCNLNCPFRRYSEGDAGALDAVFSELVVLLLVLAKRAIVDRLAAEDCVQSACLKLVAAVRNGHYDHNRPFEAYATGVLRNEIVNTLRRRGREHQVLVPEDFLAEMPAPDIDLLKQGPVGQDDAAAQSLNRLLSTLTNKNREIITDFYVKGLSQRVLASKLGILERSVKTRLQRIRNFLRRGGG